MPNRMKAKYEHGGQVNISILGANTNRDEDCQEGRKK